MALNEAVLRVTFAGGLDTKTDAKAVVSAKLLVCENAVFRRATSLQKRYGYDALSRVIDGSASLVTGGVAMGSRDDELLEFTPTHCYSRQTGADQWSDAGAVYSVVGTDRPLAATGTQQQQPDQATNTGVTAVAWEDSAGGVWWSVVDATSGRILRAPAQADASGQSPRCVAVGTNLHVYYLLPAQHRIMVLVVNPAAPGAAVTPQILTDDLDATDAVYDACPTARTGTPALMAWAESGTANLRVGYIDQSGAIGSPLLGHPSTITTALPRLAGASPLACAFWGVDGGNADVITVAWVLAATDITVQSYSGGSVAGGQPITSTGGNSLLTSTSATRLGLVCTSAAAGCVVSEESAAAPSQRFVKSRTFTMPAIVGGTTNTVRSVGLASRAFAVGGDAFATVVHDTTFFNTYVTIRLNALETDGIVSIGRHAPGNAAGAPVRMLLPSAVLVGSIVSIALPFRDRLISENDDKFRATTIRLFRLDFDSESSHQSEQLGRGLYLGGACMQHYDGRIWTEQGFHVGPELISTVNAAGGSLTPSTVYEYRAWYEWTDAQNEVHRGPTSAGTLVTMGGADTQVTLTLPTLRLTNKPNVRICVARSLAASTGKTAQLFRVTSLDPTTAGAANGYVANDLTVDTATFLDRMSDATLQLQEEIYTDGGILSNDPAPIGAIIARSKTRLFATDPSDGTTYRYSQPIDDGYGVEWPPDLTGKVDPFGGDITAMTSQDDRVVLFKRSAIWVFNGDGPTPDGNITAGGFTLPQLVTSDVGCVEPNSIVLTPSGHMFKSAKGIYMLARDGGVTYVGAPVEAYNSQRVVNASVMPDRTQVVFLTDDGSTLLYDYLFNQWSVFTNHEGIDAAVVSNTYHYLRTDGVMYRESVGAYSDAGVRIKFRLVTAWLHMQEHLQGFSRFWAAHILGTWVSPHQLGVKYQTDYTPGWTDTFWLDATGDTSSAGWITGPTAQVIGLEPITGTSYGDGQYGDGPYGGTSPGVYQFRIDLNEKGESIQFSFEDFEADGLDGASFELTELVINGGVKGNVPKPFTTSRST